MVHHLSPDVQHLVWKSYFSLHVCPLLSDVARRYAIEMSDEGLECFYCGYTSCPFKWCMPTQQFPCDPWIGKTNVRLRPHRVKDDKSRQMRVAVQSRIATVLIVIVDWLLLPFSRVR